MTKYSDLESQDRDGETKQLTNNKRIIKDASSKQEACWWCLLLCPIVAAIGVCILLTLFILVQLDEKDSMDDKLIVISNSWFNGTDIVNCSPEEPCELTCKDYIMKSGNDPLDCDFSYVWIMIFVLILGICSLMILCSLCNLGIGYICRPSKKTIPKKSKKIIRGGV